MYENLLSLTWEEIMESDYIFISNSEKRVIQIKGSEVAEDATDDSIVLVYYNMFTGKPLLLIQHYDGRGRASVLPSISGYIKERTEGVNKDGEEYTEVVYIDEDACNF